MPRSSEATKSRILSAAYKLLYREGFTRVSMDSIAEAANITKKTLYYHFSSKDELVAAVLEHQHNRALAQIQNWADTSANNPVDFVAALFKELQVWASGRRWLGSGFTRLTMELADLPGHPARRAAHQHKSAVEDWLAYELKRLEQPRPQELAQQIMLLIEGCMALVLIHGDTGYVSAAAKTADQLVQQRKA